MTAGALTLALAAACVHAGWNLMLARRDDTGPATGIALAVAVVAFAPAAALTWRVHLAALPLVAGSAGFELAYFALLAAAYARGEVSLIYPLARGLAPVVVLVVAVVALGAGTSAPQVAGVGAVGVGVMLVRGGPRREGAGLAVGVATCIAGYTLVDKEALRHAAPLPYLELVLVPVALAYLAWQLRADAAAVRTAFRPGVWAIGVGMFAAYALTLAALRLAPAASVAAVRESSIVIVTVLAALLLHERAGPLRTAGAALVTAGVAAIALA
jgi:drug/metabolite transporter (DMT)-like permease